ncbi:MAG: hypothetical protein Q4C58_07060 [Eubacteriales bacterium]|nr:hypothetical protein [Eubacteriales bacterium]
MKSKKWVLGVLTAYIGVLLMIGGITFVIDPFFHYHAPLNGVYYSYQNDNDVYMNDGIVKHFAYDAVVTGTSMTLNFKTAEVDELFGVNSVRVSFLGEGFKVINDTLKIALQETPELKLVIRGVDDAWFISDANWEGRDSYPEYLYDDNLLNDVNYLLNKDVVLNRIIPALIKTAQGVPADDLDHNGFGGENLVGKEKLLKDYERPEKKIKEIDPAETQEYFTYLEKNLDQNVLQVIEDNPDVTFYLFLPPYSILWWDQLNQNGVGVLKRRIDLEQYAIERMLEYDNVRLFSFFNNFELVCNLDNYVDVSHYQGEVNSQILQWMAAGEYELTKENYLDYIETITDFYTSYDYDAIFE